MKKTMLVVYFCLVATFITMLTGCNKEDSTKRANDKLKSIQTDKEKENSVSIELFFDSSEEASKSKLYKEERILNTEEVMGEVIIQELIKGPGVKSELKPVIPKETRLISFSIKNKIAIINFTKDILMEMEPKKEEICLKAIAGSLTQLPSVEKVKIQVDNKNVDSLGGNYDISEPFNKNDVAVKKIKK